MCVQPNAERKVIAASEIPSKTQCASCSESTTITGCPLSPSTISPCCTNILEFDPVWKPFTTMVDIPYNNPPSDWPYGRKVNHDRCKEMGLPDYRIRMLRDGCDLGFASVPNLVYGLSNYSSLEATPDSVEAVNIEVARLERDKIIEIVPNRPAGLSPMGAVPKPHSNKYRIILDCTASGVNSSMASMEMKLPTIRDAVRSIKRNWFMAKFDLKSGFQQIPVHPKFVDLLGIQLPDGRYARQRFLVFGGQNSPFIFQGTMEDLRIVLKHRGITGAIIVFIDDFFLGTGSFTECVSASRIFQESMEFMGWELNMEKYVAPTQCIEFIGFILNSIKLIHEASVKTSA